MNEPHRLTVRSGAVHLSVLTLQGPTAEPPDPTVVLLHGMPGVPATQRPLPSLEFAAERLVASNFRLPPDRALNLARQATGYDPDENLRWAFDPRIRSAVLGLPRVASERYWHRAAARAALFPDHAYQAFDRSGHMVHCDARERLAATTLDFLERRL